MQICPSFSIHLVKFQVEFSPAELGPINDRAAGLNSLARMLATHPSSHMSGRAWRQLIANVVPSVTATQLLWVSRRPAPAAWRAVLHLNLGDKGCQVDAVLLLVGPEQLARREVHAIYGGLHTGHFQALTAAMQHLSVSSAHQAPCTLSTFSSKIACVQAGPHTGKKVAW